MNEIQAPRFSVIIPAYNSAVYIPETLASLAAQDDRDFEVIVVDDGSTDETMTVATHLVATLGLTGHVVARPAGTTKGVSSCRNIGLDRARGQWIAFLDSDDLFTPRKLADVGRAIDRYGSSVRAFYHKSRRFDDETRTSLGEVSARGVSGTPRWILDELLVGNYHATCGMVVERALLLEIGGFDTRLNGIEDWWLVLQIAKRTPWVFIDESLAEIRVRRQSLMTNQPFAHYVRQHTALLRVARESGDLTAAQFTALREYVLGPLTRYFCGLAYSRGGWRAIGPGLARLMSAGYPAAAARLVSVHLRAAALSYAAGIYHRAIARPE